MSLSEQEELELLEFEMQMGSKEPIAAPQAVGTVEDSFPSFEIPQSHLKTTIDTTDYFPKIPAIPEEYKPVTAGKIVKESIKSSLSDVANEFKEKPIVTAATTLLGEPLFKAAERSLAGLGGMALATTPEKERQALEEARGQRSSGETIFSESQKRMTDLLSTPAGQRLEIEPETIETISAGLATAPTILPAIIPLGKKLGTAVQAPFKLAGYLGEKYAYPFAKQVAPKLTAEVVETLMQNPLETLGNIGRSNLPMRLRMAVDDAAIQLGKKSQALAQRIKEIESGVLQTGEKAILSKLQKTPEAMGTQNEILATNAEVERLSALKRSVQKAPVEPGKEGFVDQYISDIDKNIGEMNAKKVALEREFFYEELKSNPTLNAVKQKKMEIDEALKSTEKAPSSDVVAIASRSNRLNIDLEKAVGKPVDQFTKEDAVRARFILDKYDPKSTMPADLTFDKWQDLQQIYKNYGRLSKQFGARVGVDEIGDDFYPLPKPVRDVFESAGPGGKEIVARSKNALFLRDTIERVYHQRLYDLTNNLSRKEKNDVISLLMAERPARYKSVKDTTEYLKKKVPGFSESVYETASRMRVEIFDELWQKLQKSKTTPDYIQGYFPKMEVIDRTNQMVENWIGDALEAGDTKLANTLREFGKKLQNYPTKNFRDAKEVLDIVKTKGQAAPKESIFSSVLRRKIQSEYWNRNLEDVTEQYISGAARKIGWDSQIDRITPIVNKELGKNAREAAIVFLSENMTGRQFREYNTEKVLATIANILPRSLGYDPVFTEKDYSAMTSFVTGFQYFRTLYGNTAGALVNSLQTFTNTMPLLVRSIQKKTGKNLASASTEAAQVMFESLLQRFTSSGRNILEQANVLKAPYGKTDVTSRIALSMKLKKPNTVDNITEDIKALYNAFDFFSLAEIKLNRGLAGLSQYNIARRYGTSHKQALKEAWDFAHYTQLGGGELEKIQSISSFSPALRQYMQFPFQQMNFFFNRLPLKQKAMFITMIHAMGGTQALPIIKDLVQKDAIQKQIEYEHLKKQGESVWGNRFSMLLSHGIPAALGYDMSNRMKLFDFKINDSTRPEDVLKSFLSPLIQQVGEGVIWTANASGIFKNQFLFDKDEQQRKIRIRDFFDAVNLEAGRIYELTGQMRTGTVVDRQGKVLGLPNTLWEQISTMTGVPTLERAALNAWRDELNEAIEKDKIVTRNVMDSVFRNITMDGSEEGIERFKNEILSMGWKAPAKIKDSITRINTPRILRIIKEFPLKDRPMALYKSIPEIEFFINEAVKQDESREAEPEPEPVEDNSIEQYLLSE